MNWNLPTSVNIDGEKYAIRNQCDYRVVLDCISALNDEELTDSQKIECALFIFFEHSAEIKNLKTAINEMFKIINGGSEETTSETQPRVMDWEHDFMLISPAVGRVLGYDVRTPDKYTHWYTFLGGYQEIGDCQFANVVAIRTKRAKGQKLEKWELDYLRNHRSQIELPLKMTNEERTILDAEW